MLLLKPAKQQPMETRTFFPSGVNTKQACVSATKHDQSKQTSNWILYNRLYLLMLSIDDEQGCIRRESCHGGFSMKPLRIPKITKYNIFVKSHAQNKFATTYHLLKHRK